MQMQGHTPLRTQKVGACLKPGTITWMEATFMEVLDHLQAVLWQKGIRAIPRHLTEINLPIWLFLCMARSTLEYIDIGTVCRRC